ncbi:MAG TPA: gluconate 2-dehydrogenase subunit 3 family protein, partial [Flavisolibacter sp.]|nr:gluconate 2-dehydrogenase subunit 3 family protein [Flavisolibacter sp.]
LHKDSKASLLLKNISISAEQENMLAELAETLIPASTTPGAKDTSAHLFALRMVNDCMTKEKQQQFLKGLDAVEKMSEKAYSVSFAKATASQREKLLAALEAKQASADALAFYQMMKDLTIQGYLSSKPVLGDVFHYELVPGRYNGAAPVKTIHHQA